MKIDPDTVFAAGHAHVTKWEGGDSDHPADPGGITRFGASLAFLQSLGLLEGDIDGDGDVDRDDVLAVTKATAQALFKRHFWDRPRAYDLPPLVAIAYYDAAVNAGNSRSVKLLQTALLFRGADVDGILGPKTRAAVLGTPQYQLAARMLEARSRWYEDLAKNKPSSAVFLRGWLARVADLEVTLRTLAGRWGISREGVSR